MSGTSSGNPTYEKVIAQSRYVDDILFESLCLCSECLHGAVSAVYKDHKVFDSNTEVVTHGNAHCYKFLDMWLRISTPDALANQHQHGFSMMILPFNPDVVYSLTGNLKRKARYPATTGTMSQMVRRNLSNILIGRACRFKQQLVENLYFAEFMLYEFLELYREGYTMNEIRNVWYQLQRSETYYGIGRELLHHLRRYVSPIQRYYSVPREAVLFAARMSAHVKAMRQISGGLTRSRTRNSSYLFNQVENFWP